MDWGSGRICEFLYSIVNIGANLTNEWEVFFFKNKNNNLIMSSIVGLYPFDKLIYPFENDKE